MQERRNIETYTLLLTELAIGVSRTALISGDDGTLDGLSVATHFAGCFQDEFPGGTYVISGAVSNLRALAELPIKQSDLAKGVLIIVDDRFFADNEVFDAKALIEGSPSVALIVVSRNPKLIKSVDFVVNLGVPEKGHHLLVTELSLDYSVLHPKLRISKLKHKHN